METYEKEQVVHGVAFFDGEIDGKKLNSGTLFVKQEMDNSRGNAKGERTVEKKCDNSEIVKKLMHLEFPIKCKIVYEERVSKSAERLIVIDCVPLSSARSPVQKAA